VPTTRPIRARLGVRLQTAYLPVNVAEKTAAASRRRHARLTLVDLGRPRRSCRRLATTRRVVDGELPDDYRIFADAVLKAAAAAAACCFAGRHAADRAGETAAAAGGG